MCDFQHWNIIEETEDTLFPYSQEKAWEDLFALEEVYEGYIEAIIEKKVSSNSVRRDGGEYGMQVNKLVRLLRNSRTQELDRIYMGQTK